MINVMDREGLEWTLFAWDTKHYEFLDPIPAKTNCIFEVKSLVERERLLLD